ncbi:hypothetical protein AKJ09_08110 [Labilithrix luteola]|uniref:Uncharacterized protein n=2 Tax=Labilithrix luteola TaxID=1391654 RepID=A0A0K1Q716_9BACT|nr:hypothetical protein AKJ09_08110 [Labilithrix luteola]
MVSRAHKGASYAESSLAGKTLAAQSKLPRLIAENLGAGFGQWDFFPEATAIVDFAHAYVPPANEEDVWALARSWASDDAAGRQTLLALVGRDILEHELRRVAVPKLRELFDEPRASRARAIRTELGLATPALAPIKDEAKATKVPTPRTERAPAKAVKQPIPTRMPPPEFKRPAKAAPPPPPKRFQHPKFGEGELLSQAGEGPESKLTIKFERGPVTVQAKYVTEI